MSSNGWGWMATPGPSPPPLPGVNSSTPTTFAPAGGAYSTAGTVPWLPSMLNRSPCKLVLLPEREDESLLSATNSAPGRPVDTLACFENFLASATLLMLLPDRAEVSFLSELASACLSQVELLFALSMGGNIADTIRANLR
eukprot:376362-Pyramimonas_sp.AAC.1